jgi:hypothetical protein
VLDNTRAEDHDQVSSNLKLMAREPRGTDYPGPARGPGGQRNSLACSDGL